MLKNSKKLNFTPGRCLKWEKQENTLRRKSIRWNMAAWQPLNVLRKKTSKQRYYIRELPSPSFFRSPLNELKFLNNNWKQFPRKSSKKQSWKLWKIIYLWDEELGDCWTVKLLKGIDNDSLFWKVSAVSINTKQENAQFSDPSVHSRFFHSANIKSFLHFFSIFKLYWWHTLKGILYFECNKVFPRNVNEKNYYYKILLLIKLRKFSEIFTRPQFGWKMKTIINTICLSSVYNWAWMFLQEVLKTESFWKSVSWLSKLCPCYKFELNHRFVCFLSLESSVRDF